MSTQWQHPITNKEKVVSGGIYFKLIFYGIINGFGLLTSILELPHGWKKLVVDNKIIFIKLILYIYEKILKSFKE